MRLLGLGLACLVSACQSPGGDLPPPTSSAGAGSGGVLTSAGGGGSAGSAGSSGSGGTLPEGGTSTTGGGGSAGNGGTASAGSGGAAGEAAALPSTITILTFNVRTSDADAVDAPLGNDWSARLPLALEVLSAADPDVVGLQEATDGQVADISAGFTVLSAPGVSILYRAERLTALGGAVVDVGNYGNMDPWGTRYVNWQRFALAGSGAEFTFYNTHLSTAGDNLPQSQFVLDLAAESDAEGIASVVVGDFNYDAAATVAAKGFDDDVSDHAGTFHGFQGGRSGPRFDFVVSRRATSTESLVDTRSTAPEQPTVYPSDHYPIVVKLTL